MSSPQARDLVHKNARNDPTLSRWNALHIIARLDLCDVGFRKGLNRHGLSLSSRPEVHMINKNDMQSHEGRTKLLITCHRHGQNGWFPIGCAGLCFHGMYKNRVSVSGWSPNGCEGFHTNLNIPCPLHSLLL